MMIAKQALKQSLNNYTTTTESWRMLEKTNRIENLRNDLQYDRDAESTLFDVDVTVSVNTDFWISLYV